MTIFLRALVDLIREQLNTTSNKLKNQARMSLLHNQELSLQKMNIIDELEKTITRYDGSGNDEIDKNKIIELIEEARIKIKRKDELHGNKKIGKTQNAMTRLIDTTNEFYAKLLKYDDCDSLDEKKAGSSSDRKIELSDEGGPSRLSLINHPDVYTPENIVYYYAAFYFGGELFSPTQGLDENLRKRKEQAVAQRIQILSNLIRPEYPFNSRVEFVTKVLSDLSTDNKTIVNPGTSVIGVPYASIWGCSVKIPTTLFNPSEGRFGQLFSLAVNLINDMSEEKFKLALSKSEHSGKKEEKSESSHSAKPEQGGKEEDKSETTSHSPKPEQTRKPEEDPDTLIEDEEVDESMSYK